jgi:hypothetical protein
LIYFLFEFVSFSLPGALTFAVKAGQKQRRSPSPGYNFRSQNQGPVIEDLDEGSNRMDVI